MQKFKPYYAVIFTSTLNKDSKEYHDKAKRMEALAKEQDGFLGFDSAREDVGITVSYWKDLNSIKIWKRNAEHKIAQKLGKTQWYSWYKVRICKIEQEYEFKN
jgi:heme-degrading monooxygenase HmoA